MKKIILAIATLLSACATNISSEDCSGRDDEEICNSIYGSKFNTIENGSNQKIKAPLFTGFIVSIDKSKYARYDFPEIENSDFSNIIFKYNEVSEIDLTEVNRHPSIRYQAWVRDTLEKQQRNIFITSVNSYNTNNVLNYSIIKSCRNENLSMPKVFQTCSFEGLQSLKTSLIDELETGNSKKNGKPYSHVVVYSTGWGNRPKDSIDHYNILHQSFDGISQKDHDFNPLIIGLTWPSKWELPLIDAPFKFHDSDEVGLIWANYLINKTVPSAIKSASLRDKPKFVVMGHSLGARMMGTAASSYQYVAGAKEGSPNIDSLILLQSGFSGTRLYTSPQKKSLGHFKYYDGIENNVEAIIVTSSAWDKALDKPKYADERDGFFGTDNAFEATCSKVEAERTNDHPLDESYWQNRFVCVRQIDGIPENLGEISRQDTRILYLRLDTKLDGKRKSNKSESIIKGHGDVNTPEIAEVIWKLIK